MRTITAILLLLLPGFALALAVDAEVSGQWAAVSSGVVLELNSDGGRLTGWLSQPNGKLEITNGSVQGNGISFEMAVKIRGQALTLFYSGQVEGDELHLVLRAGGQPGEDRITLKRVDLHAPLDRFSESPAPEELASWLKANAIALGSVQPDAGFADMAPLKAHLLNARIVAMGEATHGTREFQQLKIRMFRFLVEQLGFTVFGIEANWPESL